MPDVITITTETAVFAILIAAIVLVALAMSFVPRPKRKETAADRFIAQLGLSDWPDAVTSGLLLVFGLVGGSLLIGLLYSIWHIIWTLMTAGSFVDRSPFIALAALTGALGATIALPFTAIRLRHSARQTDTAVEALFNDKINAASSDLAARRQVTTLIGKGNDRKVITEWKDDLVTRAAAIDRLEGLVEERPDAAPRVARLLSVYVRELSAEYPAKKLPNDRSTATLRAWARALEPARSDMEKAAQTLGRLKTMDDVTPDDIPIDLRSANLQGFDLTKLNFDGGLLDGAKLQGADLHLARLHGAILVRSQLQGAHLGVAHLQEANLFEAQLQGADLNWAQLVGADLVKAQLQGAGLAQAELQGANLGEVQLQGANLIEAQLQGADLFGAQLQGANLIRAQLQGANLIGAEFDVDTSLNAATLRGAALREVDMIMVPQLLPFIDDVFADSSVNLPDETPWPAHWDNYRRDPLLDWDEFDDKWRAWQATLDPPLAPIDPH